MATIAPVVDASDLSDLRALFEEYAATLDVDLAYQDFEHELESLPGDYAPPRGCLLLAREGSLAVACIAVRPLSHEACEMKRLYVRPEARGTGLGRQLASEAISFARTSQYRAMRLDTLPSMTSAHGLYRQLGFVEIDPYRASPVAGTRFMELVLAPGSISQSGLLPPRSGTDADRSE